MTQITLWNRERAVRIPAEKAGADLIEVTYSTATIPPRSVLLPRGDYREATDTERRANPRSLFVPVDMAAEVRELKAIREDMDKVAASAPPTLEVP